jgi:hypothetical protein
MQSPAGVLLGRVFDLEFALDAGFTITLADINCEEWEGLRALRFERSKYLDEKRKVEEWQSRSRQPSSGRGSM